MPYGTAKMHLCCSRYAKSRAQLKKMKMLILSKQAGLLTESCMDPENFSRERGGGGLASGHGRIQQSFNISK